MVGVDWRIYIPSKNICLENEVWDMWSISQVKIFAWNYAHNVELWPLWSNFYTLDEDLEIYVASKCYPTPSLVNKSCIKCHIHSLSYQIATEQWRIRTEIHNDIRPEILAFTLFFWHGAQSWVMQDWLWSHLLWFTNYSSIRMSPEPTAIFGIILSMLEKL